MSKVITTELQHSGASGANITLDSSKNVTCENNLQVDGNLTVTGTIPADKLTGALPAISGASLTGITSSDTLSFRNKIINGAMTVSQRNGTSAVQLSASEQWFIDRWENDTGSSFDMKCDVSQSSEAPEGFANSMKFDCDGVSAVSGSHNGLICTHLEGQNLQDLKFGTSNAEDITLSFYAKSGSQNNGHVYGIFLGAYLNGTRNAQTKGFTVTSSWQRFTMTFAGTGTAQSTAINNDNQKGLQVAFSLAVGPDDDENYSTWTANSNLLGFTGQDNFFDHVDNELYITGVQLEKGTTATDFEHRSYGDELARCQRYYYLIASGAWGTGTASGTTVMHSSTDARVCIDFPVQMRAAPSVVQTADSSGTWKFYTGSSNGTATDCDTIESTQNFAMLAFYSVSGSMSAGAAGWFASNKSVARLAVNSEL